MTESSYEASVNDYFKQYHDGLITYTEVLTNIVELSVEAYGQETVNTEENIHYAVL